jgi:hypothetical protein
MEDEMSEELRPCPFCGGKAITSTFFDWDDLEYMAFEVNDSESIDGEVTCENEHCINGWYLSPKDWNTRPIEDALNARIAELKAFIDQLIEIGSWAITGMTITTSYSPGVLQDLAEKKSDDWYALIKNLEECDKENEREE